MIVGLEQAVDEARYGGKAAQLCAALRAGLPVPPGLAISSDRAQVLAHEGEGGPAFAALVQAFFAVALPPAAVRSSAIGEDADDASFAGQHATVLGVSTAPQLREAVQRVWQSGQHEAARAYRQKLGLPADAQMGIVVQRLVQAEVAGVLFTRHPVTGADERVIEASWGLGEAVVSGLVTPDNYRVARGGRVLARTAGEKDLRLVWAADGGTEEQAVDGDQVAACCLDDDMLRRLDALATRVETTFPGAHDLEFAFEGASLFLLQRRAITRG